MDIVTVQGVLPFLVLIFTTPEVISPYSTEGTPVMTSTDSTLEEAMLLVAAPFIWLVEENWPKEPLFESRTPSTSTAVPKEALPSSAVEARMLNCCSLVRLGLVVAPPGIRPAMLETFISWTWSRAVLSMVREVVAAALLSCAVTTAPSRARLSGERAM